MNWKRFLIGFVVVAVLLGGGYAVYQQFFNAAEADEASETAVNDIAVDTGVDVVSAEGQIVPVRDALLTFAVGGQVVEILAEEGTAVSPGDAILRLDSIDQETAVIQAEAAVAQAQANMTTANAGLTAAQTGVNAAQLNVTAAEATLALLVADPSEAEIALQEANIALAVSGVNQAASSQNVVLAGPNASQIHAAEAQLAAAEAQALPLRDALTALNRNDNASDDAIENAQERYNTAVANINAAQAALDDVNAGATSGAQTAAFGGVSSAVSQREAAQAQLDLLLAGPREEQITVAETGVVTAEAAVVEAELGVRQAETAVTQAEAGVAQAQAALNTAQAALDDRTLTAPFAGIVANISASIGEVVSSGTPIVQLADFSEWIVQTTDLTELDVVSMAVGFPVDIRVDALPDEVIRGTVTDIAQVSQLTRGDVTYTVTISLDESQSYPLRWGMTVFVDVDTDQG